MICRLVVLLDLGGRLLKDGLLGGLEGFFLLFAFPSSFLGDFLDTGQRFSSFCSFALLLLSFFPHSLPLFRELFSVLLFSLFLRFSGSLGGLGGLEALQAGLP